LIGDGKALLGAIAAALLDFLICWVDNMVDKSCASYLYKKRGVYYFSKQLPSDVQQHYKCDRIVICLKTKSFSRASRMRGSILQRLYDYWLSLRLSMS